MINKRSIGRFLPIFLLACLTWSLWQLTAWIGTGAGLTTDITELVPAEKMDEKSAAIYSDLLDKASTRMLILVEGEDADEVEEATIAIWLRLSSNPALKEVDARPDIGKLKRITERLYKSRDILLSHADRVLLEKELEATVSSWVGEGDFFRPTTVQIDPLGTLGRFLLSALPDNKNVDSDGFYYWVTREDYQKYATVVFLQHQSHGLATDQSDVLIQTLAELVDTVEGAHDVSVAVSGVSFHAAASKQQARDEMQWFGMASAILIVMLLSYAFKSPVPVVVAVLIIGAALLGGLTLAHWVFGELHVLTLVMALPIIGVTVDYFIHSEVHRSSAEHSEERAFGLPRELLNALSWGCISSALGYLALGLVDIPLLRQVSVILVAGLVLALLWVVFLTGLRVKSGRTEQTWRQANSPLIRFLEGGSGLSYTFLIVLLFTALSGCLIAIAIGKVAASDNPALLHNINEQVRENDERVAARLGDISQRFTIAIVGEDSEQVLQRQERAISVLRVKFEVDSLGLAHFMPSRLRQAENLELMTRAYESLNIVAVTMPGQVGIDLPVQLQPLPVRAVSLPEDILEIMPPFDLNVGDDGQVWASLSVLGEADRAGIGRWCSAQKGCYVVDSVSALGSVLSSTHKAMRWGLYVALTMIVSMFYIRYRKRGLLAGAILLTIVFGATVVPVLMGAQWTLFYTGGIFVLVGLSVDYLVFLLESKRRRRLTWLAFCLSSATTLISFGMLLMSRTPAVGMLATPIVAGLPLLLVVLYFSQLNLVRYDDCSRQKKRGLKD